MSGDEYESPAQRQCTHEMKNLLHRWEEESDLEQKEILRALSVALNEYYGEDDEFDTFEIEHCDEGGVEFEENEE